MEPLLASPLRNLVAGVTFMLVVGLAAALAYIAAGWSVSDAFYMVVLTIYSVGYREVHPVDTPALRAITEILIIVGCTGMIFLTGSMFQLIAASQLQQFFGTRRMQKEIDKLSSHVVICGFGRIGQMLCHELKAGHSPFVVIDHSEERVAAARKAGYHFIQGDATDEETMRQAGVMRARALATVLPEDAANVFITLSARNLNHDLTIIARGELPSTESKLIHAGANRVVLPARIGAERVAELLLHQDVARLISRARGGNLDRLAFDLQGLGLDIEVATVEAGSRCAGLTVERIEQLGAGAFLVVALEKKDGATLLQPDPETLVRGGDSLAVVRRPEKSQKIEELFGATAVAAGPAS
ncbi:potassium channel protein [Rhodoblastus acidophilus]|uniref:Potassium channel protein n=1 Tax=Candidatus Rhodoblastus alkanivorans TaxID=2954117 RepID=A0ABS9Z576_9HYPH|nr:potassium channel protein [Candidatus Rhodoblastus alkanivorans]MCI4680259.1 potassium channel protein [Candidatus Rhodoblastus alkanivorans]MCI4682752.1 potassium channel protein [Candidatus Rhodoblastus alkanivorans]MDI4640059.1 potassium channel protein [Rhodoblastus acidophilus]